MTIWRPRASSRARAHVHARRAPASPCRDRPGSCRPSRRTSRRTESTSARASGCRPDRRTACSSAKVSHSDWCLEATSSGTRRNLLQAAELDLDAADDAQQPEIAARPELARPRGCRSAASPASATPTIDVHEQVQIEQDVENDRADDEHGRTCMRSAAVVARRRDAPLTAARSAAGQRGLDAACAAARRRISRIRTASAARSAPLVHHGSARSLSVTTGNGTSATSGQLVRDLGHARAACDSSTSPRSASGSRGSRAQRRVSIALPSVLSERSKSTQQRTTRSNSRIEARDLVGCGRAVDAADQQALAAAGRQQLDRVGDARGAAGEHDDAVGIARRARPPRPARAR